MGWTAPRSCGARSDRAADSPWASWRGARADRGARGTTPRRATVDRRRVSRSDQNRPETASAALCGPTRTSSPTEPPGRSMRRRRRSRRRNGATFRTSCTTPTTSTEDRSRRARASDRRGPSPRCEAAAAEAEATGARAVGAGTVASTGGHFVRAGGAREAHRGSHCAQEERRSADADHDTRSGGIGRGGLGRFEALELELELDDLGAAVRGAATADDVAERARESTRAPRARAVPSRREPSPQRLGPSRTALHFPWAHCASASRSPQSAGRVAAPAHSRRRFQPIAAP